MFRNTFLKRNSVNIRRRNVLYVSKNPKKMFNNTTYSVQPPYNAGHSL